VHSGKEFKKLCVVAITGVVLAGLFLVYIMNMILIDKNKVMIEEQKRVFYEAKYSNLNSLVDISIYTVEKIYMNSIAHGYSHEGALKKVSAFYTDMFFYNDKTGYIFIFDEDGVVISLPDKKQIGTNILDLSDSKGKKFVKDIIQKAMNGGGIVNYEYINPLDATNKESPKRSVASVLYMHTAKSSNSHEVKGIIVGTGLYIDELEREFLVSVSDVSKDSEKIERRLRYMHHVVVFLVFISSIVFLNSEKKSEG